MENTKSMTGAAILAEEFIIALEEAEGFLQAIASLLKANKNTSDEDVPKEYIEFHKRWLKSEINSYANGKMSPEQLIEDILILAENAQCWFLPLLKIALSTEEIELINQALQSTLGKCAKGKLN